MLAMTSSVYITTLCVHPAWWRWRHLSYYVELCDNVDQAVDYDSWQKYRKSLSSFLYNYKNYNTLSGRMGKMVASHADGCKVDSRPAAGVYWFILCTRRSGGTAHEGGGCDQSIGSTVSDALALAGCGRVQLGVPIGLLQLITACSW